MFREKHAYIRKSQMIKVFLVSEQSFHVTHAPIRVARGKVYGTTSLGKGAVLNKPMYLTLTKNPPATTTPSCPNILKCVTE